MLKQSRFLTAFQQDGNPLVQLNQERKHCDTTYYAAYLANQKKTSIQ